tara:strand:- start:192 stop:1061 length:870 start_codon:yes stop_codon:yes gene_type:complete
MDSVNSLRKLVSNITGAEDSGDAPEELNEMYSKYHADSSKVRAKIINDQNFPIDASLKFIRMDLQRVLDWDANSKDYDNISSVVDVTVKMLKSVIRHNAMTTPSKGQTSGVSKTIQKSTKGPVPGSALDIFKPKHPRPRGAAKQGVAWDYDNGTWVSISEATTASLEKPKPKHARPRGANKKDCVWNYDTGMWIPESELDATTKESNIPIPMQDDPNGGEGDSTLLQIPPPVPTDDDFLTPIANIHNSTENVKDASDSDEVDVNKQLDCSSSINEIIEANSEDDPMGGF